MFDLLGRLRVYNYIGGYVKYMLDAMKKAGW